MKNCCFDRFIDFYCEFHFVRSLFNYLENIARNKQTRVKGYDNSFGQSTVNGNRTDCSFLVQHDIEVMRLRVELEETYNIHGIIIFTSKNSKCLLKGIVVFDRDR